MKKLFYIILAAAAIVACSKEAELINNYEPVVDENGQVTYTFKAYIEDITKASISESNGKFSWGDAGDDQIAVWDAAHSKFVTFTSTDNAGNFSCETDAGANFNGQVAYYPASIAKTDGTNGYDFPTSFTSLTAAAKGFPMSGTVTADGKITFAHLGCLINMTLNNVPSFTRALILYDGSKDIITVTATPTDGVINAVVPVPAGTYVLTAKLKDDNNNIFYTKARESKTYTARNYYTIKPISLGKLLTFTNEAGWDSPKVHIWQYGNSGNVDITTGGTYPHKLYLRNSNVYYVLLDKSVESWTAEGNAIGVQFVSTTNASNTTQTDCVYLFRNIDFTIPGGGGLKTSYRTYLKVNNGSWANDAGAYIREQYNVPTSFTSMTELNTKLYYYEWPVNYYGYGLYVEMQNSSNTDWYVPDRTDDGKTTNWWSFTLNRDLMYIRD